MATKWTIQGVRNVGDTIERTATSAAAARNAMQMVYSLMAMDLGNDARTADAMAAAAIKGMSLRALGSEDHSVYKLRYEQSVLDHVYVIAQQA